MAYMTYVNPHISTSLTFIEINGVTARNERDFLVRNYLMMQTNQPQIMEISPYWFVCRNGFWNDIVEYHRLTTQPRIEAFGWITETVDIWRQMEPGANVKKPSKPKINVEKVVAEKFWPLVRRLTTLDEKLVKKILCR